VKEIHAILGGVELGLAPDQISYNPSLGFIQVNEFDTAVNGIRLLGFGLPIARQGGVNRNRVVRPITEFSHLPGENRTVAQQGKGVGARMYNVYQALAGGWKLPVRIGAFTFDIDPNRLLDARTTQGNRLARIGRHASRIAFAKVPGLGLERLTDRIHQDYEAMAREQGLSGVDGVELEMPPLPELRQAGHGVHNPEGIKPQFIIIRNPDITLHHVGSVSLH
jgi:hypothetical protein